MLRRSISVLWFALLTIFFALATISCGGGASAPTNPPTNPPTNQISVSITPTTATVAAGATQQFQAVVTGSSNTAVQWQVNGVTGGNAANGTISTSGLYTAPSTTVALQVTVAAVAAADATKSASAAVTVNALPAGSIVISPTTATLAAGAQQQFTATVMGETNPSVTWSVDGVAGGNGTVGRVSSSGLYTAPASAGSHTVTATVTTDPNKSASATVSVVLLTVSPQSVSLAPNGQQQFTATVQGTNNTGVTWSVNGVAGGNNTVGTITSGGFYSAPGTPGTYAITATSMALPSYSVNATATVQTIPPGVVSVLTYHNDDARDGANLNETTLNPTNVNSQQFGKIIALPVDGQIYAQPLYVPNVNVSGTLHNVVLVATENDTVYAFDADGLSSQPLWERHLATALSNHDEEGISPLLGITSTPVIDPVTSIMYLLTDGSENGHKVYRLHALNIGSGAEMLGGPVVVTGTVPGTGWDSNNGQITLESSCYQRSGLALDPASGAVYISFGHCNHGWILAYDKGTLQRTAIYNTTPDGAGGAVWGGGGAPAIDDSTGDLYLITGVDLGDPAPDYNDSAMRLSSGLSLIDYFKPSDETYLRQNDADFGSGSPIIMPDNSSPYPHELIGGGKDGRIIVMNRDNMGQYQTTDHVIQEVQTGTQQFDNIFATPTFWNGTIYYHDENDVVKAYYWYPDTGMISTHSVAQGNHVYGVHGATSSLSANGTSDAILWEIESTNQPNNGAAILHAYDATNLHELYNSSQAGGRDTAGPAVKFTVPTVADGHVFVGTGSELDIYGLLPQ
jgi:hypothetical protein